MLDKKKILLLVLVFSLPFAYVCASDTPCYHKDFSAEVQTAAFFPLGSPLRHIYGSALPLFTLAGNWWFHKPWGVWMDISYAFGNGHAIGYEGPSSHLNFIPLTAGIKYVHRVREATHFYIGFGPAYSFLVTTDRSEYVHRHTSTSNFGLTIKTGFMHYFNNRWFFQGFFNYMYQKMYFQQTDSPYVYRYKADLSSLQLGIGVGARF